MEESTTLLVTTWPGSLSTKVMGMSTLIDDWRVNIPPLKNGMLPLVQSVYGASVPLINVEVICGMQTGGGGALEKEMHCEIVPHPLLVERVIEKTRSLRLVKKLY